MLREGVQISWTLCGPKLSKDSVRRLALLCKLGAELRSSGLVSAFTLLSHLTSPLSF